MGTTPVYSLPYPAPADPADVPTDMHELALAVEQVIGALAVVPIGAIIDWPYASGGIPSWALLPYGQAISRTTYAALNALASAAGYPHGPGDGSTTFTLPDLRGRVLAGKDDMGGTAAGRITAAISGVAGTVLGGVVGSEGVTLTTAQLPAHNHVASADMQGSHSHAGATGGSAPGTDAQGWHSHGGATGAADRSLNHQHLVYAARSGGGYGLSTANAGFKENVGVSWGAGGVDVSFQSGGAGAPDHLHGISGDGSHSHNVNNHTHAIGADGSHAHNITVNNAGGGGTTRVTQPTIVVNKFMRAQ